MDRCNIPPKKKKKKEPQAVNEGSSLKRTATCKEGDEKHVTVSNKTYAYISPETVTKIAESVGIPSISEDIAVNLAEDVSYKLQEIISASCSIMRCCKRRKLRTTDISAALHVADTPPVFGHSTNSPFNFISVPDADVFVGEDNEVDLSSVALGSACLTQPKPSHVASSWPILESVIRPGHSWKSSEKSHTTSGAHHSKIVPVNGEIKHEKFDALAPHGNSVPTANHNQVSGNLYSSVAEMLKGTLKSNRSEYIPLNNKAASCNSFYDMSSQHTGPAKENGCYKLSTSGSGIDFNGTLQQNSEEEVHLSSAQFSYVNAVSNCLLRGSDDHFQQAVLDLRSNQKLGMVVAPLLNLVALTVYHVPRHFGVLMRMLETIDALLDNQFVNPSFSISVNRVVNALLAISSDQNVILSDDFLLRRKAAHLLTRILAEWNVEELHVTELLSRVALVLGDSREPIQSQYGALVIFQSLGKPVLQGWVLPILVNYLPQLEQRSMFISLSTALQIEEIRGVLLNIVELLNCSDDATSSPSKAAAFQQTKALAQLDQLLYQYIGDAVCARRQTPQTFRFSKRKRPQPDKGTRSSSKMDLRHRAPHSNLLSIHFHGNAGGASERRYIQPGVFQDVPLLASASKKEIHFRFAGANPVPKEKLKRRVLDKSHARFVDHIHGPLHMLYQRQFPMVGHMLRSRMKTSVRNIVSSYSLLSVI